MKHKLIKKIMIVLCTSIFVISNSETIIAYDIDGQGSGISYPLEASDCGDGPCYGWAEVFKIRATLSDDKGNMVPGTKTIQFSPCQPSEGCQPSIWENIYELKDVKYNKSGNIVTANTFFNNNAKKGVNYAANVFLSDMNTEETIVFMGSARFGNMAPNVNNENREHNVYMGIGKDKLQEISFNNFNRLREDFLKYIVQIGKKETKIPGTDKSVNFVDYFLYACGFTDNMEASKDYETLKKIHDNNYYISLEPIYQIGASYNGKWHSVIGTGNQLAQFAQHNLNGMSMALYGHAWTNNINRPIGPKNYWSIMTWNEIEQNIFCNFVDGKGLFTSGNAKSIIENTCTSSRILDVADYGLGVYWMRTSMQSQPNLPFGVISINISELYKEIKTPYGLTYDISTCNSNNFVFDSTLFSGRTNTELVSDKNSIYEAISALSNEDRQKYFNIINTADEKELWCYDDVTYDFHELKTLEDKTYKSGTLAEIPSGKLTVNRTCFSSKEITDTTTLNNILIDDNIGSRQYQNEFTFKFNGKNYTYKKENKIYPENRNYNEDRIEFDDLVNRLKGIAKAYIYTSSFDYYYRLDEGFDSNNAKINIMDLSNNLGQNNLNLQSKFFNGKLILIPSNDEDKYTNELNSSLTNAYGLSTKTINQIKENQNKTIQYSELKEKKNTLTNTVTEITLEISEDKNELCKFESNLDRNVGATGLNSKAQFRVISLNNPFPARDGTSRLPGSNWLNEMDNNVYDYIQNNRNVKKDNKNNDAESVYNKEPLYTITLTPSTMVKIREYNKSHNYSNIDMTCESGTGRMCVDNFIRDSKYIPELNGTCKTLTSKEITQFNNRIKEFELSGCNNQTQCMTMKKDIVNELDTNKDGYVTNADYLNADFYTCADKTYRSGG